MTGWGPLPGGWWWDGHTLWCIVRLGWTVHGADRGKESFGSVEIYRPSFPYCSNQEKNLLLMIDTWHDTSSRLQCSALVSSDSKFCIELLGKLTCSVGTWDLHLAMSWKIKCQELGIPTIESWIGCFCRFSSRGENKMLVCRAVTSICNDVGHH